MQPSDSVYHSAADVNLSHALKTLLSDSDNNNNKLEPLYSMKNDRCEITSYLAAVSGKHMMRYVALTKRSFGLP
jgi:hypothetical protein